MSDDAKENDEKKNEDQRQEQEEEERIDDWRSFCGSEVCGEEYSFYLSFVHLFFSFCTVACGGGFFLNRDKGKEGREREKGV